MKNFTTSFTTGLKTLSKRIEMKRRKFIVSAASAIPAITLFPADLSGMTRETVRGKLEKRSLGKTGEMLSVIGFGGIAQAHRAAYEKLAREGALIMGHRYNSWWTGSVLSIHESRKRIPHQNATTLQVAIGLVSAVMWMMENPNRGICMPDDLPYEFILDVAKPYLGKLLSVPSGWTPLKNYQIFFKENPNLVPDRKNIWSFKNFLFCD